MKNIPVFLLSLHILLVMLFNGKVDIKFIEKMVGREDTYSLKWWGERYRMVGREVLYSKLMQILITGFIH